MPNSNQGIFKGFHLCQLPWASIIHPPPRVMVSRGKFFAGVVIGTIVSSITIWIDTIEPYFLLWIPFDIIVFSTIVCWYSRSNVACKKKFSTFSKQYKEDNLALGSWEMIDMNANFMNLWTSGCIKLGQIMKHVIVSTEDTYLPLG